MAFSLGNHSGKIGNTLFYLIFQLALGDYHSVVMGFFTSCEMSSPQMCSVKPTGERRHSWTFLELEKYGLIYLLLQIVLHRASSVERCGLSFWHAVIKNRVNISLPICQRKRILCENVKLNLKIFILTIHK